MKFLVFLQNAWSPMYAGRPWPRPSWLKALHASRSGQRLRSLEGGYCFGGVEWRYENASPIVTAEPSGIAKPDVQHMRRVIVAQRPDVILALGKWPAQGVLEAMGSIHPLTILAPHPGYRVLTNGLYQRIGSDLMMLQLGFVPRNDCCVVKYEQKRGYTITTPNDWLIHSRLDYQEKYGT